MGEKVTLSSVRMEENWRIGDFARHGGATSRGYLCELAQRGGAAAAARLVFL